MQLYKSSKDNGHEFIENVIVVGMSFFVDIISKAEVCDATGDEE